MKEKTVCFAKGVGTGLIVGSAIGMAMTGGIQEQNRCDQKKDGKHKTVSKAFKTIGDIVDNIGDAMGM